MNDPKYPVENQDMEEKTENVKTEHVNQEVDDHGRGPHQPVYGDSYEEEFAQDAAAIPANESIKSEEKETTMKDDVNTAMAWFGITAAVLSFFFAPLILGIAGIVLGIVGKRRGADTLGNMAIIISIVSMLFAFFFAIF